MKLKEITKCPSRYKFNFKNAPSTDEGYVLQFIDKKTGEIVYENTPGDGLAEFLDILGFDN